MVFRHRLMKSKCYPNPHAKNLLFGFGLETAVVNQWTIIPICHYDEGLQTASLLETNPENAAFVEDVTSSIYPDSTVDNVFIEITMSLTKAAITTDKIVALNYAYMPIFMNFKEDYTAVDELSTETVGQILEMQTETTDRQGSPIYNNVKMPITHAGGFGEYSSTMLPFMDTNIDAEAVAFSADDFYDALQFHTTSNKLKTVQGGLKWKTLTQQHPIHKFRMKLNSKIKRANEYMFGGLLIGVPAAGAYNQIPLAADTTNVTHVQCRYAQRYLEWNENFNNVRD